MKTMLVSFDNDFHGTSVSVRAKIGYAVNNVKYLSISKSQVKKVSNTLCGINGCQCRNPLKEWTSEKDGGYYKYI